MQRTTRRQRGTSSWLPSAKQVKAQTEVGLAYLEGRGVIRSEREALEWLRGGGTAGDADVQLALDWTLSAPRAESRDLAEAVRWFRLAAAQGESAAMRALGEAYETGDGVHVNPNEALLWYRQAARKGEAVAHVQGCAGIRPSGLNRSCGRVASID